MKYPINTQKVWLHSLETRSSSSRKHASSILHLLHFFLLLFQLFFLLLLLSTRNHIHTLFKQPTNSLKIHTQTLNLLTSSNPTI